LIGYVDYSPAHGAFRREIRAWIERNAPPSLAGLTDWRRPPVTAGGDRDALDRAMAQPPYAEWERRLLGEHLVCPHWPESVGGRGWDAVRLAVFDEECFAAGVPRVTRGLGESLVGPSILAHGTDEQKRRFLPSIVAGRDTYCQGFSEPNHGSDLAAIETRGIVEGDELVVTGQKVWTSGFQTANLIFVLCRTYPAVPKHRGLSLVLMKTDQPGIEFRPIRQLTGAANFAETFLDGARAPLDHVIGGLGNGWAVANTTLGHERATTFTTQSLPFAHEFGELLDDVEALGRLDDRVLFEDLARAYTAIRLIGFARTRMLLDLAEGRPPGPESSTAKLFWSEYHQRLGEVAFNLFGTAAMARPHGAGYATTRWQEMYLRGRAETIFSGTSQIQRNIIAERILGLPRS
jgi:alkylation response protein AidB-like acyl-CoA dehydrogenase